MTPKTFSKPDFIAIGPPKTGTTWIYRNLELHPQVWMPPDKEIRFFWERAFIGDLNYKERKSSTHWHHLARQIFCQKRFGEHRQNLLSVNLDVKTLWWDLKYAYGTHTDKWYSALFDKSLLSGDISAKYCELPDDEVHRIYDSFPNLKILITLRDPVEREWSRAKMNLCKRTGRKVEDVPESEFLNEFNDPPQRQANDYVSLISRWTKHFGENQTLVLFYDDLLMNPIGYFNELCKFLQISAPEKAHEKQLNEVVFKGVKGAIPEKYEKYLFDLHKSNIANFAKYISNNDYPQNWLEKHKHLI